MFKVDNNQFISHLIVGMIYRSSENLQINIEEKSVRTGTIENMEVYCAAKIYNQQVVNNMYGVVRS